MKQPFLRGLLVFLVLSATVLSKDLEFQGWKPYSPREEIRPGFRVEPSGGPDERGGMVIEHDEREGLDGAWARVFEVGGDAHYRITAFSKSRGVRNPRHHSYVELLFHDATGKLVRNPKTGLYSRPFYARVVGKNEKGWTRFADVFYAPPPATHATVKLHLRWEPEGSVEWGAVSLEPSAPPDPRKIRLAAVNYSPRGGKSTLDNCRQFDSRIARAAERKADLVVLGECITSVGNGLSAEDSAEPIPGPVTNYLGRLADRYDIYIVTTLYERVDHRIFNTAVLLDPEGRLVGRYRKVCLARGEYRSGIAPGSEFPVFDTDLGKIGLMICFDVHMPEVARGLAANGAEIIAMPIMGGHPDLARARAIENQVYLVTSTYSVNDDWMQTGVWDLNGKLLVRALREDEVVVAEVDLSEQNFFPGNMGDFRSRLRHERPAVKLPE